MKDGLHVFWLRNEHRHPVTCVASKLQGDQLTYAVATHNPHDTFNRATGRNKAVGRLNAVQNPATTVQIPEGVDPKVFLLKQIAEDHSSGPLTRLVAKRALIDIAFKR
jgi:hypothetical protein